MDIITATESKALILTRGNENTKAQILRQDIMKTLKTAKRTRSNLTREQSLALRELKSDEEIAVYPFDKGSGLILIKKGGSPSETKRTGWGNKSREQGSSFCIRYINPKNS